VKFNRVSAVVNVHVHAKYHQAECSGSLVIVVTEKKNSYENKPSITTTQTVTSETMEI